MAVAKRLSKVARELNVGISTIVDFLEERGTSVEANPNTKIDVDTYDILLQEFQSDQSTKERADEVAQAKRDERLAAATVVEPEPVVVVEEAPVPEPVVEAEPVVEEPAPVVEEEVVAEEVVEEVVEDLAIVLGMCDFGVKLQSPEL